MINYEFVEKLSQLSSASRGTSLITMYIPGNYALSLVSDKLKCELSTASNIKSKNVRNDVITAIKSAQNSLKSYNLMAPENGLVLCSGEPMYCS